MAVATRRKTPSIHIFQKRQKKQVNEYTLELIWEEATVAEIKNAQERDELHRAIWAIADELRGAVDGWDFKNYVLGTMFYRYISENLCSYVNQ